MYIKHLFCRPSAVKQGRSQSPSLQENSDGGFGVQTGSSGQSSSLYGSHEPQETGEASSLGNWAAAIAGIAAVGITVGTVLYRYNRDNQ